jgi:hypothetical protein
VEAGDPGLSRGSEEDKAQPWSCKISALDVKLRDYQDKVAHWEASSPATRSAK